MLIGLSNYLQAIGNVRKTLVINAKFARRQVDIATLRKTRLPDFCLLREVKCTFV